MANITPEYYSDPNYVKLTVKQNDSDYTLVNDELRWNMDNRIPVAGWGMLNPDFQRYFKIGTGCINYTDFANIQIRKDGKDEDKYRFVDYGGGDIWIKSNTNDYKN